MSIGRRNRTITAGLAGAIALTAGAWMVGRQIRSPAEIAAQTSAPGASAITVPVERRVLSSEVIVRGTVRYGSPQPVVLASSDVKQSSSSGPVDSIVTTPPLRGARVGEGSVAMTISGRPVFVLRGAQPSHRDLGPNARGPDVRQLETALRRMGFFPGPIDGRYDGDTAAAVASWYESKGYQPLGATDSQLDALRLARAAASQARDAYLQSRLAVAGAPPGDIAQARIDLETARDIVDGAVRDLASQRGAIGLATLNRQRDYAIATAEVTGKRAALNRARDALVEAQRALAESPPDTSTSERVTLEAGVRQATDDVSVAQAELNASLASARATAAEGRDAVRKARADFARVRRAVPRARRQVTLAERRLRVLRNPGDTQLQQLVSQNAAREARQTAADARRLARKIGVQVPADEVLFFKTLPLRVDSVRSLRGDSVVGRVMTVSNSRLAIDSSLSLNDAKLVHNGAPVTIEEPDLGVRTTGTVTFVADRPGTHKVDPGRIYLEVAPKSAPAQLVGTSVKLTIAVKSTGKAVLAVPLTALSVGADGSARIQVTHPGGQTEYVTVNPGLAAKGLVEVRPVHGRLAPGDLAVVGAHGGSGDATPRSAGGGGATGSTVNKGGVTGASGSTGTSSSGSPTGATP
jgi:peptidoglycan hydrolase-like protein with peptidoglycan-binding domain